MICGRVSPRKHLVGCPSAVLRCPWLRRRPPRCRPGVASPTRRQKIEGGTGGGGPWTRVNFANANREIPIPEKKGGGGQGGEGRKTSLFCERRRFRKIDPKCPSYGRRGGGGEGQKRGNGQRTCGRANVVLNLLAGAGIAYILESWAPCWEIPPRTARRDLGA